MSWCNLRVVLHGADEQDYEALHAVMEEWGFSRFITGRDDEVFQLPPGEYRYQAGSADYGRRRVMQLAASAAATTGLEYSIRFTDAQGTFWINLPMVQFAQP